MGIRAFLFARAGKVAGRAEPAQPEPMDFWSYSSLPKLFRGSLFNVRPRNIFLVQNDRVVPRFRGPIGLFATSSYLAQPKIQSGLVMPNPNPKPERAAELGQLYHPYSMQSISVRIYIKQVNLNIKNIQFFSFKFNTKIR